MSDTSDSQDTHDPTQLREEVEAELEQLTEEAAVEEKARMEDREEAGVDEPT
jgi:hypothetical protein